MSIIEAGFHSVEPGNRIHICSICGAKDTWGRRWRWKLQLIPGDQFGPGYETIVKYCSEKCRRINDQAEGGAG